MTLREIAETITGNHWERGITVEAAKMITTLLNAVVKERAVVIRVTQRQQGLPEPRVFTEAESKEVALHELNLEGVWTGKEG